MSAHFSSPRETVLQLGLRDGMKVADFGAGSGHYTHAAAGAVSPSGKVYAIDIQEDLLARIKRDAHTHHLSTITTVWGDIEKPGGSQLRDATLDAAVLANTLFQVEHKDVVFRELKRVLKPGGKLLVVDWAGSYGGVGPDPAHVVTEHQVEEMAIGAGFHKVKSLRAGAHHYGIIFTAP